MDFDDEPEERRKRGLDYEEGRREKYKERFVTFDEDVLAADERNKQWKLEKKELAKMKATGQYDILQDTEKFDKPGVTKGELGLGAKDDDLLFE